MTPEKVKELASHIQNNDDACSVCWEAASALSAYAAMLEAKAPPEATGIKPVAVVLEQLDENQARIQWMFNPVPEGATLQWDHGPGEFTGGAVSVLNPQGTEETGNDRSRGAALCQPG